MITHCGGVFECGYFHIKKNSIYKMCFEPRLQKNELTIFVTLRYFRP